MWTPVGRHARRLKELRRWWRRRPAGRMLVHGRRLVADFCQRGLELEQLWATPEVCADFEALARSAGFAACVEASVLERILPIASSQGVVAVFAIDEPEVGVGQPGPGLTIYLDGVQDPGNVGAVLRSAAAFGHSRVWLGPECADPFGVAAVRASAGAVAVLELRREVPVEALLELELELVVAMAGGEPIEDWAAGEDACLVLGAEGAGVDPRLVDGATRRVGLPLSAGVESLNVAVTAGILLHRARSR